MFRLCIYYFLHLFNKRDATIIVGKVEMVSTGPKGRDAYGVKAMKSSSKGKDLRVCYRCVATDAGIRLFCRYVDRISCRVDQSDQQKINHS